MSITELYICLIDILYVKWTKVLLPQAWATLADFDYHFYWSPTLFNYLAFQYFAFEGTWWMLFRKRVGRTKFDIYVFIKAFDHLRIMILQLIACHIQSFIS